MSKNNGMRVVGPVAVAVIGSLAVVVASQKPLTQQVMAAPIASAVSAQEAKTFDPYQPVAVAAPSPQITTIIDKEPALVSAMPMAAASLPSRTIDNLPASMLMGSQPVAASNYGGNSSGSGAVYERSGVLAASSTFTAPSATVTVGSADIFVLSSFRLHYGNQVILSGTAH